MITLNLFALFFVAVILTSLCKNRRLKTVIAAIFGIFTCMQLVSLYAGGSFCDYKFFVHFNFRDFWWGATNAFTFEIWLLPVALFGISAGIFFLSKLWFLQNAKPFIFIKCGVLIFFLLVLVAAKNGIVDNLRKVYIIHAMPELHNFDDIYKSIIKVETSASSSVSITKKEELQASSEGKNIVIIFLESFNRAYFLDKNQQLVPKLRELKRQWNFYPMHEHLASGWTAGSLYTTLTGLPALFSGNGNRFFQSTKKSKLVSLIDVLEKAGYETHFLSDDAEFAGTKDILNTFGVHHILDKTLNGKYSEKMRDVELFAEAKNILKGKDGGKPVMIYIATLATHAPSGIPDIRLYDRVKLQKSTLETAVYQTDYLVGDFVDFLKQQGFMENTVVYIFPDHPFPGRAAILNTSEEHQLWFLTNAAAEDLSIDTTNFYQIDLPRNILSGAKVKHNAVFLSDFIKGNKSDFIDENISILSALNAAHIEREKVLDNNFEAGFFGSYAIGLFGDDILFIDRIDSLLEYDRFIFLTEELRVEHSALLKKGYLDSVWLNYNLYIKVGVKNSLLEVTWGRNYGLNQTKTLPLTAHLKMNHARIKKTLAAISTEASITRAENFPNDSLLLDYLPKILQDASKVIAITCFDEASIHFAQLNPILKQVGLKESLVDCFRCSYIAAFSKNKIYFEKVGSQGIIHRKLDIGGVSFCLSSGGFDSPACAIAINGENYAACARGLNFVIFNTNTNQVEDVFNVDFYDDAGLGVRRF